MGKVIFFVVLIVIVAVVGYAFFSGSNFTFDSGKISKLILGYDTTATSTSEKEAQEEITKGATKTELKPLMPVEQPDLQPIGGTGTSEKKPPAGFSSDQLSPLFGRVLISSVIRPSAWKLSSPVQIKISMGWSSDKTPISITGWYMKNGNGDIIQIPQAVADYAVYTKQNGNITLESGGSLTIYNTRSPVGNNFRINKCTGYLNNEFDFSPELPKNCPRVDWGSITNLSSNCQTYISRAPTCHIPTPEEKNSLSGAKDAGCGGILSKMNYNGCYTEYKSIKDFFSKEWRAWVNQTVFFNSQHDRLLLFDPQGLLVDEYSY